MKQCSKCKEEKPLEQFSKGRAQCKPCRNEWMKAYYKENREACIQRAQRWAAENPERKRVINRKSNMKMYGTPSAPTIDSDDHRYAWDEFLHDFRNCWDDAERYTLCAVFIDTGSARVNTLPVEVDEILVKWEEGHFGTAE